MRVVSILLMTGFFAFFSLYSVAPAMIIKSFFDDRIVVDRRRILLCIGVISSVSIIFSVLMFLTDANKGVFIAFLLLMIVLILIVMPIIFAYRRGMPKLYYAESLLLFFAVMNVCFMCTYALSFLLSSIVLILDIFSPEKCRSFGTLITVPIFLLLSLWLYFAFVRKKMFLRMRKTDTLKFLIYYVAVQYFYFVILSLPIRALPVRIVCSLIVFSVILILVFPVLIIKSRQTAYLRELSTRSEQFLEAELAASNAYRQSQEDTRAFRHDMNNNLAVISSLMRKGSYSEAEEYVNELHGRLSSFSPKIVTGDDMLDALISSKLTDIENNGIRFTVNGVIDGGLGWKPIDICAVFANMIDNAVEACVKVVGAERNIDLTFRKTEHQRIITMKNSTAVKVDCSRLGDGSHYTSKADSSSHGFGVKNIRDTLDKVGAMMQLSCSETEFMTTIILTRMGAMR